VFHVEPVGWARTRQARNGHFFTPKKQRDAKAELQLLMKQKFKGAPLEGALSVSLLFSIRKPKSVKREYPTVKCDIDNYEKQVFDSGNGILWKDDMQIVEVHSRKVYGEPSIWVVVREL